MTVNIKRVFDRHAGFQKEMEKFKSEAAKLSEHHARLTKEIDARKKQLDSGDLSDEARKRLNEVLLREEAQMSTYTPLKQRELMEREARLYASVYKEMQEAGATLARNYGSQIVFRDHELDAKTLSSANIFAILFQQGVDKTDDLVHLVNESDTQRDDQVKPDEAEVGKDLFRVAVADFHKILSAYPKYETSPSSTWLPFTRAMRDSRTNWLV